MASVNSPRKDLVDSAIVIAIITGACYAVGYWGQLRDARNLGIPVHLLPPTTIEATLLSGAAALSLLAAFICLAWALFHLVFWLLPHERSEEIQGKFRRSFGRHKVFYTTFATIAGIGVIILYSYWFPLQRSSHQDDQLPDVTEIRLKDGQFPMSSDWKYLARDDGIVVLKKKGQKNFMLLREDALQTLSMTQKEQTK